MSEPSVRKTFKEQLRPTPTQQRQLERVLWRGRTLSNTALEQRITAWERGHVCLTREPAGSRVASPARGDARVRQHPEP